MIPKINLLKTHRVLFDFSNIRKLSSNVAFQPMVSESETSHIPVLCNEVLHYLNPANGDRLIDMTFGAGGHTKALLKVNSNIKLFCLDQDPTAYKMAQNLSKDYSQIIPCLGKFSELPGILSDLGVKRNSIDGILFDFGCSSMQFDTPERGFSINKDGPLDMRMDNGLNRDSPTAADVLACADEEDLAKIFKVYGEEKKAKKIARAIVEARYIYPPLKTTSELASLVANVLNSEHRQDKLMRPSHVATKIFQALRIFVNNELNEIDYAMNIAHYYLKVNGKVIAISFHSLEDTIVKRHITGNVIQNTANSFPLKYSASNVYHDAEIMEKLIDTKWMPLNKHVITPSEDEILKNPRSRSARLRAAVKLK